VNRAKNLLKLANIPISARLLLVRLKHRDIGDQREDDVEEQVLLGGDTQMEIRNEWSREYNAAARKTMQRLRTSKRGVSIHPILRLWRARRKSASKNRHLGYYASDLAASMAYQVDAVADGIVVQENLMRMLRGDASIEVTLEEVRDVLSEVIIFSGAGSGNNNQENSQLEGTSISEDILKLLYNDAL